MENDIAVWRYLHSLKAYPAVQNVFSHPNHIWLPYGYKPKSLISSSDLMLYRKYCL